MRDRGGVCTVRVGGEPVTFVITQPCIDTTDQSCVDVCPVDCIHFEEGTDRMLYIDPVECIDCGACEPACPVDAIFTEDTVPEDQARYYEINVLWYQDPAAARAKVEALLGGAPAGAPAAETEAPVAEGSAEPASEPAAEAEAPAGEATEEAAEALPVAQGAMQVEAVPSPVPMHAGVVVPHYSLPSPRGLVATAGLAITLFFVIVFPGSTAITVSGVSVGITVLLLAPLSAVFLLLFLKSQVAELAGFAARSERIVGDWRQVTANWRRSEESRRYHVERTVREIADARYRFPDGTQPDLRTYVNLPQPEMALEFGGGGGEKVFPDILVTRYPGNYPVMVAQVETSETLSRDQAKYVWARLENEQAPLDLYVPAGLAGRAKDYARAAGIKHLRLRTWRRQPHGLTIREL